MLILTGCVPPRSYDDIFFLYCVHTYPVMERVLVPKTQPGFRFPQFHGLNFKKGKLNKAFLHFLKKKYLPY